MATKERKRKSERLTPDEHNRLKYWVKAQLTKTDAAEIIGLSRANLDRIVVLGSCSPKTAVKIREVLNA